MNAQGLWQGQADPPLSELGEAQAEALATSLAAEGTRFAALVCSDLERARHTAAALGRAIGLEPEAHTGLREMDVGEWSGRTHDDIRANWGDVYDAIVAGDVDARPPGGESRRELRARLVATLEPIAARHPAGDIAVVTHGGVVKAVRFETRISNTGTLWIDAEEVFAQAPDGRVPQERSA